jgi:predicted flap endonuclease-1-like 5' DNA nuclease
MTALSKIEGIGSEYARKLRQAGVGSVEALLKQGASPQGREDIAKETGISGKLILEWVNHADLFRIKGVGEEYSDLLEEAGVDTVVELAQRNAQSLYQKLMEANAKQKLVRKLPTEAQVGGWIAHAKQLKRVITY